MSSLFLLSFPCALHSSWDRRTLIGWLGRGAWSLVMTLLICFFYERKRGGGWIFVDEVEDVPEIRSQWPTGGSRSFYGRTTLSRRCAGDRICNRTSSCPGYCARVTNTHTRVTTHTRTHTHTPGQPKGPEREAHVNQNSIIITNLFCSLMLLIFH